MQAPISSAHVRKNRIAPNLGQHLSAQHHRRWRLMEKAIVEVETIGAIGDGVLRQRRRTKADGIVG